MSDPVKADIIHWRYQSTDGNYDWCHIVTVPIAGRSTVIAVHLRADDIRQAQRRTRLFLDDSYEMPIRYFLQLISTTEPP